MTLSIAIQQLMTVQFRILHENCVLVPSSATTLLVDLLSFSTSITKSVRLLDHVLLLMNRLFLSIANYY